MKYTQKLFFACAALLFTIASCKKEDVEKVQPTCLVTKMDVYQNDTVNGSVQYTYTDKKLTKADFDGGYYTFEYANNRISKRNYYDDSNPNVVDEFASVSYNADGTISKIEYFDVNGSANERFLIEEFAYTGGKINKLTTSYEFYGSLYPAKEYAFTWSGANISRATSTDYQDDPPTVQTYDYTFDTNGNYFAAQNMQLLLTDPIFETYGGVFIPALASANNVKSVKSGSAPVPFDLTYTLDDRKNVQLIKLAGETLAGYSYQCQ